ncbi:MAG: biopolymer transporter ExbD [Pirellulaceae bacterium]
MKVRNTGNEEKIELQMTPMIDIVFQLLVFFIMTFKIVSQEGDFDIKMPLAAQGPGSISDETLLPLTLELQADATGKIARIQLNERSFGTFPELHDYVVGYIGTDENRRENTELEIRADYQLRYENVIEALSAVRGRRKDDGTIEDLITKIKFAPPQEEP